MENLTGLVVIAVVGGVAIALQGHFMGLMDTRIGTVESVCITYAGGGLFIGLAMLALRGGNLAAWHNVPWYALSAGVLGLVIVGSIGYTAPRLGLVAALTIIICSQLAVAALLDNFGLFGAEVRPLSAVRIAGIGVMLLGVWLVTR